MAEKKQYIYSQEQQTEPKFKGFFNTLGFKKVIAALLILGLILVAGLFLLAKRGETPQPPASPTTRPLVSPTIWQDMPVIQIDKDSFSQSDIDYLAKVYLPARAREELSPSDQEKVNAVALEHSIVIQEARKRNLVNIGENIFLPNKNWRQYNQTFQQAKEAIIAQEEQISVAGVFIFFYNQFPPDMGAEAAKLLTRAKMEAIRQKLIENEIDLIQAAELIRNDKSLSEIDPVWDKNAYAEFRDRNRTRQIVGGITSEDNELLWSLNVGEYSPIILGYETGNLPKPNEAYWTVFQVTDKTGTEKPYLQWLEEAKENYAVKNL